MIMEVVAGMEVHIVPIDEQGLLELFVIIGLSVQDPYIHSEHCHGAEE